MVRKTITILATLAVFAATAASAEARHLATGNLKANIFAEAGETIIPIQCSEIWVQGDYAYLKTVSSKNGICSQVQSGDAAFMHWDDKKAFVGTGHQTGWVLLRVDDEESCQEPAHAEHPNRHPREPARVQVRATPIL